MNKQSLVRSVANATKVSDASAKAAVDAVLGAIQGALKKHDTVRLVGFGTFGVRRRNARVGRNPATGATIKIKAARHPVFKAGSQLKAAVK